MMKKIILLIGAISLLINCSVLAVPPKDPSSGVSDPDSNIGNHLIAEPKNETSKAVIEYPQYGNEYWERDTTGNQKILVIPIMFSDVKNSTTIDDLKDIMENLTKYFYNVSYGKLNLTYEVKNWVTLNKPISYYGADGGLENQSNMRIDRLNVVYNQLGIDVVKAADSNIDFSQYDHLIIVYAGEDQANDLECTDCLWSMMFPYIGVETDDYNPECTYYPWSDPCTVDYTILVSETDPFGVYAHEFGHELGLPDLYDTNTGSSVVGLYEMMDVGSWINSNFGAWIRLKLRFSDAVVVYNESINLTIYPALENDTVVKVIRGNPNSWQYYLVEMRKKEGYDSELLDEGVLIWKIDESWTNNEISKHEPMVELFLFNESGNFTDNEGGISINITLNPGNATLSILSSPRDLNITNRILDNYLVSPVTCKSLDIYTNWPAAGLDVVLTEGEAEYFTTNDPEVIYWAKVNANIGDNVTFEFINNTDNDSRSYKNITWIITKNISHNNYIPKLWNWFINPVYAGLSIDKSMMGNWSANLFVNGVFYYSNNFTITNKIDTTPPSVTLLPMPESTIYDNFPVLWNASDTGENASGLGRYLVEYYDNDSSFFGYNFLEYATIEMNATFYGSLGHTYCFRVTAFDLAGNSNVSEIECITIGQCKNLTGIVGTKYLNSDTILCDGNYSGVNIIINSSDIFLDCNGSTLSGPGSGSGSGIYVKNKDNVTIRNCNLMNYWFGIYLEGSSGSTLVNNIANFNEYIGIYSSYSSDNNITLNTANFNDAGIYLESSPHNIIMNNTADSNAYFGFYLDESSENTISKNTAKFNDYAGIYIYDNSNFNNITSNKLLNNTQGITISDCDPWGTCHEGNMNNTLMENEISNNGIGIYSQHSNSKINSNFVCKNWLLDFNSSDWFGSYGNNNTCDNPNGWNGNNKTGCRFYCHYHQCDLNHDGIIINDWNDLMKSYKCFLGIQNCNKINYQNWNNMKKEYLCFTNITHRIS